MAEFFNIDIKRMNGYLRSINAIEDSAEWLPKRINRCESNPELKSYWQKMGPYVMQVVIDKGFVHVIKFFHHLIAIRIHHLLKQGTNKQLELCMANPVSVRTISLR